jgi:NAD(P)H-nitrite reductase large subunit
MIKDGEKGAVLQIDNETYAIAPHTPAGIVTPELLRRIADVAEKHRVPLIKVTSAYRIGLFGVREEEVDQIWAELNLHPGHLTGLCVRSVRCCPGNTWCRLGQRDSMAMALRLDELYHGLELINKCKIAVSGCPINCAEGWVRDIGLFPQGKTGWVLLAGGNVGPRPRLAQEIARGLDDDQALAAVRLIIELYREHGKRGERIGKMLDRLGPAVLAEPVGRLAGGL